MTGITFNSRYKNFKADSFYHVFNRGVEKRSIFLDPDDENKFLELIDIYLNPLVIQRPTRKYFYFKKKYDDRMKLYGYCLMNNHFHLLLKQVDESAIKEFMQSIGTSYSKYFNKKYSRVGPLFQNRFNAILVDSESSFTNVLAYIHNNPVADFINKLSPEAIEEKKIKATSSYRYFVNKQEVKPVWLTSL